MTGPASPPALGPQPRWPIDAARTALWRRWLITTTVAECLGFAVPAVTGAVAYSAGVTEPQLHGLLVLAGAMEGAILGAGQASVLASETGGFDRRAWIGATAMAAAFAWSLGLLPAALADELQGYPVVGLVVAGLGLAAAPLASLGVAQWLVLRRYVDGASAWIPANAAAWLGGLGVCVSTMSILIDEATPMGSMIAIALVSGLLMATVVALVTGWVLVRLVAPGVAHSGATSPVGS